MTHARKPWKVAVVVSSLSLGCAYVAYQQRRFAPQSAQAQPPAAAAPAEPAPHAAEEDLLFPSSKALLGPGSGGAFRGRSSHRRAEDAARREAEEPVLFGGSKSMLLPLPSPGKEK